jgi:hypothetical protein
MYAICLQNTMEALHLLISAGFVIHWEKSSLTPSTDFPFLGFQWNMVQASIAIPQVKVDALRSQASILSNLTSPTCRQILVLTRLIAASFKAVPLLCLKGRWLQVSLNSVYSSELDLQKTVTLSLQARRDLNWIISHTPHQCFAPLWNLSPEDCDLEVQTDASKIGYGIWFQGSLHQGHWDGTTTLLHINVLESTTMWIFLDCVENRCHNHTYSLFLPRSQSMLRNHAGIVLFVRHDVKLSIFILFFYFWLGFFLLFSFFLLAIIHITVPPNVIEAC